MAAVPETTTTNLSTLRSVATQNQPSGAVVHAGFFDSAGFELLQRAAKMFATSTLVPQQYQGNVANCAIALNLARRLKADELMVMQNLYIVHGNPGWSAKFLIASVNTCGRFTALRYEWRGEAGKPDFGCRAWAIEKATGERLDGVWVDWKMVKAEGWDAKSGSKWKTMPDQMFVYRSAAFWVRAYAPEISMGLSTVDELVDVIDIGSDGSFTVNSEEMRGAMRDVDAATGEIKDAVVDAKPKPARKTATAPAPAVATTDAADRATDEVSGDTKKPEAETQPPASETKTVDGKPAVTFAEAQDALNKAKTLDELDDAATLIGAVANREHQKELNASYATRREALGGD